MNDKKTATRAVQSMTGFGHATSSSDPAILVEMRGVNARFLEINFRLPDDIRQHETALRELIRSQVQRGKVECRVQVNTDDAGLAASPDPRVLERLRASLAALEAAIPGLAPPGAAQLLTLPGLFGKAVDPGLVGRLLLPTAQSALTQFIGARTAEGGRLRAMVEDRLAAILQISETLHERLPELVRVFEERLTERLRVALSSVPGADAIPPEETMARIRQEVTTYGLRADAAEELDRLRSHVTECRARLAGAGPVGKRLDFLTQELNREANTLAAKASAIDLSQAAVELKVLIEQIREQIQNLE
ncbi:MAG: YicC/YloC family endoribonuclease [Burkholderiaceae bacterium]